MLKARNEIIQRKTTYTLRYSFKLDGSNIISTNTFSLKFAIY